MFLKQSQPQPATLATFVVSALGLASSSLAQAPNAWIPVWSEEFNGSTLDPNTWSYQFGTGAEEGLNGWGNNELQYYTNRPENLFVSAGLLNIVARAESFSGRNYTSARIRSKDKREILYGRVDARIKVPAGKGLWPAFWMLPTNSPYGGWAACGEVDILETINFADRAYATVHYGGPFPSNTSSGTTSTGAWANDFHVFTYEWEPDQMRWYIDGSLYYGINSSTWFSTNAPDNPRAPFDVPFHFLINVAVGGNFPGSPNGSVGFPGTLQVDYIRVSQRPAKAPFSGTAPILPQRIEAENFDTGGASTSYMEGDYANLGNIYRTQETVDIEPCSEGGFNVFSIRTNEWLEYTVNVPTTGEYDLRTRVSSSTGGSFRIEFAGLDKTGTVTVPNSAGPQNWRTVRRLVNLNAGTQVLRFVRLGTPSQQYSLNYIDLLVPGDVNNDGRCSIADLYAFDTNAGPNLDTDGDGTPSTPTDRAALLNTLRTAERADILAPLP
jgi:beta-glucanase (GH16 family)